jgi:outer membrane lipoprotein-sorting protein
MRILRFSILIILLSSVLAACAANQITAEEVMQRMKDARESLQTVHGVADVTLTTPERSGSFTVEGWAKKSGTTDDPRTAMTRAKVLTASDPELANTEFVSNGETFWLYNPDANKVLTGNVRELDQGQVGADNQMAQMLRMQEWLQRLLDNSNVVLESQDEQVAGRDTYKVVLTPDAEMQQQLPFGSLLTTTLWIDQQTDLPVKAVVDARDQGSVEVTVNTLNVNQPLEDDVFTFTPPAGTEVIDATELIQRMRPQTTTLDQAREQASFPLLAPSNLPEGVQLDEVQVLQLRGETVIQNFSGSINFSLVQSKGDLQGDEQLPAGAEAQQINVRGQSAELITGGGAEQGTFLSWQENGVTIVIAGTLNSEQATTIAESLQ